MVTSFQTNAGKSPLHIAVNSASARIQVSKWLVGHGNHYHESFPTEGCIHSSIDALGMSHFRIISSEIVEDFNVTLLQMEINSWKHDFVDMMIEAIKKVIPTIKLLSDSANSNF